MKRIMCDRCRKDIGYTLIRHKFEIIGFAGYRDYDLCGKCKRELIEWLERGK